MTLAIYSLCLINLTDEMEMVIIACFLGPDVMLGVLI